MLFGRTKIKIAGHLKKLNLLVTLVVVVVVGGGGITFIHGYWESPCMVLKNLKQDPIFLSFFYLFLFKKPMYGLNAHV